MVLRTYLVYNTVVWLSHFFCCGGKLNFVQIFLLNDNLRKFLLGFFILQIIVHIPDRGFLFLRNTLLLCKSHVAECLSGA